MGAAYYEQRFSAFQMDVDDEHTEAMRALIQLPHGCRSTDQRVRLAAIVVRHFDNWMECPSCHAHAENKTLHPAMRTFYAWTRAMGMTTRRCLQKKSYEQSSYEPDWEYVVLEAIWEMGHPADRQPGTTVRDYTHPAREEPVSSR